MAARRRKNPIRTVRGDQARCGKCLEWKGRDEFSPNSGEARGFDYWCRDCRADLKNGRDEKRRGRAADDDIRAIEEAQARARRIASDHEALRPEDFDVTVGNDGRHDPKATKEKRQEFSKSMGDFADGLTDAARRQSRGDGNVLANMPPESGTYVAKLSEQERRFGNRRLARSISLAEAHEALAIRRFKEAAAEYLAGKIVPTGYALKPGNAKTKRAVCLLLSDLHLGAELHALDEPMPFRAVEEARRLEFVLRQALDFKPQYRSTSELVLLLNGDMIQGQLGHDIRGGAPLTEQKVIFWRLMSQFVGACAQQYPKVRVICQPGNHGRDKVRHPGRATSRKWDGHEWELYWALSQMSRDLRNVAWQIDFRAVSIVDLFGQNLGLSHADTEVKIGNPDSAASRNAAVLDRINSTRMYGVEFAAWAFGHYHMPRYHPRNPRVVHNGALIPPDGYSRTEGYIGEPAGQFLWESVEGFPVGDLRFVEVGRAQDTDERLGKILTPFRFEDA